MTVFLGLQKVHMGTFTECHWLVNDSFETVYWMIFLSMSVIKGRCVNHNASLQKVHMGTFIECHWPVNDSFLRSPKGSYGDLYRVSLTGQWQFSQRGEANIQRARTFDPSFPKKCHWPVNDIFLIDIISFGLWPYVIDFGQWQQTYGHLSLTGVNDNNLWTNLQKSVIDRGQWQKKVSLTGCILSIF